MTTAIIRPHLPFFLKVRALFIFLDILGFTKNSFLSSSNGAFCLIDFPLLEQLDQEVIIYDEASLHYEQY